MTFEDIKIVEFDEGKSSARDSEFPGLFRMHLRLSASPPSEWTAIFDDEWPLQWYSKKQRAAVEGEYIVVLSRIDDLKTDHLPALQAAIADTNRRYRKLHEAELQKEQQVKNAVQDDQQRLRELKKTLKFD